MFSTTGRQKFRLAARAGQRAGLKRGIYHMLKAYGVPRVFGVKSGFGGLPEEQNWVELTHEAVQDIHNKAGTILESERGNARHADMAGMLQMHNCKQLFILGGDGAHKGALQLGTALKSIDHECALVAIPSTVDNDLNMVDTSFGFDTACTEARDCVSAAYVEATCNANCIGLVKLLGNGSGFLAMNATLAARNVDMCLLPEMEIDLPKVLAHCEHVMATKGHAVIVVADGAKESLFRRAGISMEGDVGTWLRDQIMDHFKEKSKPLTVKYIDPTYMVRSVKANANDSAYCAALADHAVHAAMAGFTCVSVVRTYMKMVYLPIHACVHAAKRVNPMGRWFSRMAFTTGQPRFEPEGFEYRAAPSDGSMKKMSTPLALNAILPANSTICRLDCVNLGEKFTSKQIESPLKSSLMNQSHGSLFLRPDWWTTQSFERDGTADSAARTYLQFRRCGPSQWIHFDTSEPEAAAAIVTCGGLCPGLNNVIREIVQILWTYGCKTVYGIIGGYKGCVEDEHWVKLTPETVENIHKLGGSVLVSDRGNPPHSEIAKDWGVEELVPTFVILELMSQPRGIGESADCLDGNFEQSVRRAVTSFQREIVWLHEAACGELLQERDTLRRELQEVYSFRLEAEVDKVFAPVGEFQRALSPPDADVTRRMTDPADSQPLAGGSMDRMGCVGRWAHLVDAMLAQSLPEKRSPGTAGPTLQLYPLWVAKQTAKQAGFAAASKLRLNISSVLKTGDSLLDNDACFQRYIMNPYGSKRLAWGILGVILILWDLVVIPLTVFKLGQVSNFLDIMSIITFAYWLLDLPGVNPSLEGSQAGKLASGVSFCLAERDQPAVL
ncbi:unnamed protein product [Effrenium voratum]|nr:unnamed protein product [Effrenium voratum]